MYIQYFFIERLSLQWAAGSMSQMFSHLPHWCSSSTQLLGAQEMLEEGVPSFYQATAATLRAPL